MGVIAPQKKFTREYMESGSVALDASNPTVVTTSFSVITACVVSMEDDTAPALGTSIVTAVPANVANASTISIYAWLPESSDDTTLVASTGTETVHWLATGY